MLLLFTSRPCKLMALMVIGVYQGDLGKHQPLGPNGLPALSPKIVIFQKVRYKILNVARLTLSQLFQVNYASALIDVAGLTFAKLSVLLFYRRIFTIRTLFRWPFFITFGFNLLWGVSFFFTYAFQCIPVNRVWTTIRGQSRPCVSPVMYLPFSYRGAILDFVTIALPVPMVLQMKMPNAQKFAVLGIFFLGSMWDPKKFPSSVTVPNFVIKANVRLVLWPRALQKLSPSQESSKTSRLFMILHVSMEF